MHLRIGYLLLAIGYSWLRLDRTMLHVGAE